MEQLSGLALALTLAIDAAGAAQAGCQDTGSWRRVESADVVLSINAVAKTPGWSLIEGPDDTRTSVPYEMTEIVKNNIRFNGSDNGPRNEVTVRFRRPGVIDDVLSYTITVQARKRNPEGVTVREIKVKGFDSSGVTCTRNVNPYKRYIWFYFELLR